MALAHSKTTTKKPSKKVVQKRVSKKKASTPSTASPITRKELYSTVKRAPLGHLFIEQRLRENGFRGGITTDKDLLKKYSTDESVFSIHPQMVIQPKNQQDIEIAVRVLSKEALEFPALSLTPRAAGTGLSGGSLTDSIVIDVTAHMHNIVAVAQTKDRVTVTVEPGTMWKDVERELKKHRVYLPCYPASKDICTIGGAIANNSAGPDSLRYGQCADWVESLDVTLYDGKTYTLQPLTYKEYVRLSKKKNALATILREVFALIKENEKVLQSARPKTKKNSAGYALWDVLDGSVSSFKKGNGTMNLARLICGSQGTIGVITSITLRTEPIKTDTQLVVIPIFNLQDASHVIKKVLEYNPINVELFDALTYDLALQHPEFFRARLGTLQYYKVLVSMYTMYHVRYARKIPEFTLLVTLDPKTLGRHTPNSIVQTLKLHGGSRARVIASETEKEMFWQIRRASYTLSKFQDKNKRPAAFLEDMIVPVEHLSQFFTKIKGLLQKYNVTAAVHGHGGNGHLHFYPLLDFTKKSTPALIEKMAEEFFSVAAEYGGTLCGEHNDGIIRTPHLSKMFSKRTLGLFEDVEGIFDPQDIFNPGKKVNPRFDVKDSIRKTN